MARAGSSDLTSPGGILNRTMETTTIGEPERIVDPFDVAKDITIKCVISLAALFGIILMVLILARKELRRSRICWFVLSGLFGIFIKVLAVYPMELWKSEESGWTLGGDACHAYLFLSFLASSCIAVTIPLLSLDRLIFAYFEESYSSKIQVVITVMIIIATWLSSLGLASVITFYLGHPKLEHDSVIGYTSCELSKNDASYYWPLVDFLSFAAVPSGLNILILVLVFGSCCRRRALFYEDRSPLVNAIVLLFVLNVLYIALVCPIHSVKYLSQYYMKMGRAHHYSQARVRQIIYRCCEMAEASFYALFPVILLLFVQDIRDSLKRCCKKK